MALFAGHLIAVVALIGACLGWAASALEQGQNPAIVLVTAGSLLVGVLVTGAAVAGFQILAPLRRLTRFAEGINSPTPAPVPPVEEAGELGELYRALRTLRAQRVGAERTQLESIRLATEELRRSNTQLQQFASAASHDLREPLRTISSFSQLLARSAAEKLTDDERRWFEFVEQGGRRMALLLDGLLEFSRVHTAGNAFEDVRLDDVVDAAVADLDMRIKETNATVEREDLPEISGDSRQLMQLFQNLIANSIKYARPDVAPKVFIVGEETPKAWIVEVRDNGIGIPREHRERVFEPFRQLHRDGAEGVGIGLTTCLRIAERHHGTIAAVDSEEGATIRLSLPREQVEEESGPVLTDEAFQRRLRELI